MSRSRALRVVVIAFLVALPLAAEKDKGESPEARKLKARATAPKESDIDANATLDALVTKKAAGDWSSAKGASLEGVVVQVEKEADGDLHVVLAPAGSEKSTDKWVIVEVTPTWQKKGAAMSLAKLKALRGKTVRATGWLFFEPDADDPDPRGTPWELHPATEIVEKK